MQRAPMHRPRGFLARLAPAFGLGAVIAVAAPPAPAAGGGDDPNPPTPEELYDAGKALFDEYAPPEVKRQFEFPSQAQWDDFAARLQQALAGDSLDALAGYEPEARAALAALQTLPDYAEYATWLEQRLDLIEAAGRVPRAPGPAVPGPGPGRGPGAALPYYGFWLERLRNRPVPPRAASLLPVLRAAFAAEGVPADLAWMAEVESSFNPRARSPAGARGLFQLMPQTAEAEGLRTLLPDERLDPDRSAHAAARLLRRLHDRLGDWPLAVAAYNAGEGRVTRALSVRRARTFREIEPILPAETRLYVPKVYATIAVRGGTEPGTD